MFCEYCGKELKDGDKFCEYCGAKVDFPEEKSEKAPTSTEKPKKKHKALKIVIIFLIILTIFSCIFWVGMALIFKDQFEFFDDTIDEYKSGEIDEDDFYDEFEYYFDKYFDDDYYSDNDNGKITKSSYKGADEFYNGQIITEKNAYKSAFSLIEFSLPSAWEIGDNDDIEDLYESQGLSETLYDKNLLVYDFTATNSFDGSIIYIAYYNADYYNDSQGLNDFNSSIKAITNDYETDGYEVEYAEDSTITLGDYSYSQLAARISYSGQSIYQYDFTRMVNDTYYMQISIFTSDLDDIGDIIDCLNNK